MDAPITELLHRVREGDSGASDELMQAVYAELRRIAGRHLTKERSDHTLQPTALVNEVYLRMFAGAQPPLSDRAHFLAIASRMMRSILVDYGRARGASRRGGEVQRTTFTVNLQSEHDTEQQDGKFGGGSENIWTRPEYSMKLVGSVALTAWLNSAKRDHPWRTSEGPTTNERAS